MDTTQLRVIDALARTLGQTHSIRGLVGEVEALHGTAHYANVHDALRELAAAGTVAFEKAGRSKVPRLSLSHPRLPDTLAELELWRKRTLLEGGGSGSPHASTLLALEESLCEDGQLLALCLVDAERNLKLRRVEPLLLTRSEEDGEPGLDQAELRLTEAVAGLASDTGLRIDPLVLDVDTFGELLVSREANPLPRMLRTQTCLLNPQQLWRSIRGSVRSWSSLAPETPARLDEIPEEAIAWNLSRFGYVERGRDREDGARTLCPEVVITAALSSGQARWVAAAGVVLSKADYEPGLLAYLAKTEGQAERLLGVLQALDPSQPGPRAPHTRRLLEAGGAQAEAVEADLIRDTVDLYGR